MHPKHFDRIQWHVFDEKALPDHRDHRGRDQDLRKLRQLLVLISPRAIPSAMAARIPASPFETTSR